MLFIAVKFVATGNPKNLKNLTRKFPKGTYINFFLTKINL